MFAVAALAGGLLYTTRQANAAERQYQRSAPKAPLINSGTTMPILTQLARPNRGFNQANNPTADLLEPRTGYSSFRGDSPINYAKQAAREAGNVSDAVALMHEAVSDQQKHVASYNLWKIAGPPQEDNIGGTPYVYQRMTTDYSTSSPTQRLPPIRRTSPSAGPLYALEQYGPRTVTNAV